MDSDTLVDYRASEDDARPHSWVGIISFAFGVSALAVLLRLLVAKPGAISDELGPRLMMIVVFGPVIGLIVGALGLFEPRRKRLFAILGMLLSGLVLLMLIAALAWIDAHD